MFRLAIVLLAWLPVDLQQLATSFLCTEIVTVEVRRSEERYEAPIGKFEYLLRKPGKAKNMPYVFKEQRSPKPKQAPWAKLEQPVPLSWLVLEDPDPQAFEVGRDCDDPLDDCITFSGLLAFRDGRDPREWRGSAWRDETGRIRRVEAEPVYQGRRIEGTVERVDTGSGFSQPMFRVDSRVEELRCEIDFAEMVPGVLLPRRTACHRDEVKRGGKIGKRWSILRKFTNCKLFTVETEEKIESVEP